MQAAGRASHRMRNTLICALPLAHQPAVVDAQIGGSGIETQVTVGNVTVAPAA
jgi:hypothetical protein